MQLLRLLLSHPVASAVGLGAVYLLWVVLDRLYLSPIARFPGPKLAALTHLYEFYWDTICCGQFTFQIGRLHEKYGQCKPPDRRLRFECTRSSSIDHFLAFILVGLTF